MWEEVARQIREMGGEIRLNTAAKGLRTEGWKVRAVEAVNALTGATEVFEGDYFFSTAPVQELIHAFDAPPPANVMEVADGLVYRDFITVGLLVRSLKIHDDTPQGRKLVTRQLDLHPGAGRADREAADLQQLESAHGG